MIKIVSADFLKSCELPDQFPRDRLPEVAFVGRSNVGKSSLINSLLNRKSLAKVSRTPGKTRLVNFFRIATAEAGAKHFYVVDLPGYGYAKVAKSLRAQWQPMIERYLAGRHELRGVFLLVDSRGIEAHDRAAFDWLCGIGQPPVLVMTKVDKLTRNERTHSLVALREMFEGAREIVPYSSMTHEGREGLWQAVRKMVRNDVEG
jgi:GTP-binding protein